MGLVHQDTSRGMQPSSYSKHDYNSSDVHQGSTHRTDTGHHVLASQRLDHCSKHYAPSRWQEVLPFQEQPTSSCKTVCARHQPKFCQIWCSRRHARL